MFAPQATASISPPHPAVSARGLENGLRVDKVQEAAQTSDRVRACAEALHVMWCGVVLPSEACWVCGIVSRPRQSSIVCCD